MICPADGFVFYDIDVDELFAGPIWNELAIYFHPRPGIQKFHLPMILKCPICRAIPGRLTTQINKDGSYGGQIFTNKGWMPVRERPK